MSAAIPVEQMMRYVSATAEQRAVIDRYLTSGNPLMLVTPSRDEAGLIQEVGEAKDARATAGAEAATGKVAAPRAIAAPAGWETCPATRCLFERSGSVWRVVFDGAEAFHLEDTLGARYLNHLLHHANEPITAFDLEVLITPEKGKARDKQTVQLGLDGDAVRAYLRELERLRSELEEAESAGDYGEAERLSKDIAAIEAELKAGGKSVDTGERARVNVCKRVMDVRKRLQRGERAERAFAAHLDAHLSLGFQCLYTQPQGGLWE